MRIAVSIPEDLYKATGTLARRLGISRTRLYETALADFTRQQDNQIMSALNKVHGEDKNPGINPLIKAAAETILTEELGPVPQATAAETGAFPTPPTPASSSHPTDKA